MRPDNHKHYVNAKVLRINVGYILSQTTGYSSETEIEVPTLLRVADDLTLGHFYATLRLTHAHGGVLVQGRAETSVLMECSRCVDEIWLPLGFDVEELFAGSTNLDTQYRVGEDYMMDLAPLIREEALLHVPMNTPTDTDGRCLFCERTMQDILREHGMSEEIDPRLEILKSLRNRLNQSEE